jgi:hypothetical protein
MLEILRLNTIGLEDVSRYATSGGTHRVESEEIADEEKVSCQTKKPSNTTTTTQQAIEGTVDRNCGMGGVETLE